MTFGQVLVESSCRLPDCLLGICGVCATRIYFTMSTEESEAVWFAAWLLICRTHTHTPTHTHTHLKPSYAYKVNTNSQEQPLLEYCTEFFFAALSSSTRSGRKLVTAQVANGICLWSHGVSHAEWRSGGAATIHFTLPRIKCVVSCA